MPTLWLGNFDFEAQCRPGYQSSSSTLQRQAELAPSWLALARSEDFIWTPEPFPDQFFEGIAQANLPRVRGVVNWLSFLKEQPQTQLVPWGWTPTLIQQLQSIGYPLPESLPSCDIIRHVNDRSFSFTWEQATLTSLAGAAEVTSIHELCHLANSFASGWVVKAPLSHAARERLKGAGPLTTNQRAWAESRLETDHRLYFEPWVQRIDECGLQWEIPRQGPPRFIGFAIMHNAPGGEYRGSQFITTPAEVAHWQPAIDFQQSVVTAAQQLGYVGPLGIDAMHYRLADGSVELRPIQDINARFTMGRLSLGWKQHFPHAQSGVWYHCTSHPQNIMPGQIILTSPQMLGNRPARLCSWLEVKNFDHPS